MSFRIVADENMPLVTEIFSDFGDVEKLPGRTLSAEQIAGVDILLVRSVTQVNVELLSKAQPKFIGTATIGTDHLDTDYLAQSNIPFSSAPGCNAEGVVDYVLSSIYQLAEAKGFDPISRTWGIIGVGNVGGRLAKRLEALGCTVLFCDPPGQQQGKTGFVSLAELLANADIICCHAPLVLEGEHPSLHLLGEAELAQLKTDCILLNAGRGAVIDNQALLEIKQQRADLQLVLDVWEGEPIINIELGKLCEIATPHIAGYSIEGKVRGTFMLYQACCAQLNINPRYCLEDFLPQPEQLTQCWSDQLTVSELMQLRYTSTTDDANFRESWSLSIDERAQAFDRLRKTYPRRYEFNSLQVTHVTDKQQFEFLQALGFNLEQG